MEQVLGLLRLVLNVTLNLTFTEIFIQIHDRENIEERKESFGY